MKRKNLAIILTGVIAAVTLAGCGGGGGGGSTAAIAPAAVQDGRDTTARQYNWHATATARLNTGNYVGIPAQIKKQGRETGLIPAGAISIELTPSTKGMSIQSQCGADNSGRADSIRTSYIWLAMAAKFCWEYDGMLQFDLSPLQGIDPFNIVYAELRLYEFSYFGYNFDTGSSVWEYNFEAGALPNTSSWDEATAWYYNQPTYDITYPDDRITLAAETGWKAWDVTEIAQDWMFGFMENNGVRLVTYNSYAPSDSNALFFDEESGAQQWPSLAPKLVVYYVNSGTTPPVTSTVDVSDVQNLLAAAPIEDTTLKNHLTIMVNKAAALIAQSKPDRALKVLQRVYNRIDRAKSKVISQQTAQTLMDALLVDMNALAGI